MTSKQLESLVAGIKKPNLKENEVRSLLNKEDFYFQPMAKPKKVVQVKPQQVAQPKPQQVAQPKPQQVVQPKPQQVVQPKPQQVAQPKPQQVAQPKPQQVAQPKPQQVAQAVVQGSWVAQEVVQTVVQVKPQQVAQKVKQPSVKTQVDKDVEKFKEEICQIDTIEGRKRYCIDIGFGISSQSRGGKQHYLFGIKKIEGKKYSLYIGNSKRI
jgi:hypothetical protein